MEPTRTPFVARSSRCPVLVALTEGPQPVRADQTTYAAAARQLEAHLKAAGVTRLGQVDRHHVEDFMVKLVQTRSPATASNHLRALQQFFTWLVDGEEIDTNPMVRMRPPQVPEKPVLVVSDDGLRWLLTSLEGRDFASRRDKRRGPPVDRHLVAAFGAGRADPGRRRPRRPGRHRARQRPPASLLPVRARTGTALDRYVRVRGTPGRRPRRSGCNYCSTHNAVDRR